LNFETVKYFNAEKHEEKRFGSALDVYMGTLVTVARAMFYQNVG